MTHRGNSRFARSTALDVPTAASAPPVAHDVPRSPGQPLDIAARAFMEPRFGHDFSRVCIHSDARASLSAQRLNALAYTIGNDIFFHSGHYRPHTAEGRHLLAHELTHVVQQAGQKTAPQAKMKIGRLGDRFEQQAEHIANEISANRPVAEAIHQATGALVIQRAASFFPGPVYPVKNLADQVALGRDDAGYTTPMLNGRGIDSDATIIAAIHRPVLAYRRPNDFGPARLAAAETKGRKLAIPDPIHEGLIEKYRSQHGIPAAGVDETGAQVGPSEAEIKYGSPPDAECRVERVPLNEGSFEEEVLTPGPWKTIATRENLLSKLSSLSTNGLLNCIAAGPGIARLDINGSPSDAAVAASTRTHEDQHAADIEAGFNAVLVPWDDALTAAQTSGKTFRGPSYSACEEALYDYAGGTPDEIAKELLAVWKAGGRAFHETAAGKGVLLSSASSDPACKIVSVTAK